MTVRRRLSRDEARLWARVAETVRPLTRQDSPLLGEVAERSIDGGGLPPAPRPLRPAFGGPPSLKSAALSTSPPRALDSHGLDAGWERRLAKALVAPDFTLDLHGHSLEAAHRRLDMGLAQAITLGARVVLLITGRPRPVEAADRGSNRGAIRAKVLDWLALGPHASKIAAVRPAHRRHGGAGALYVVLRRPR